MPALSTLLSCASCTSANATRPSTTSDTNSSTCTICLEPLTIISSPLQNPNSELLTEHAEPAVTIRKCGHVFGRDCLMQWMRDANTCPMCRVECFPKPQASKVHEDADVLDIDGVDSGSDGGDGVQHFALGVYVSPEFREEIDTEFSELRIRDEEAGFEGSETMGAGGGRERAGNEGGGQGVRARRPSVRENGVRHYYA